MDLVQFALRAEAPAPADELDVLLVGCTDRSVAGVARALATSSDPRCRIVQIESNQSMLVRAESNEPKQPYEPKQSNASDQPSHGDAVDLVVIVTDLVTAADISLLRKLSQRQPRPMMLLAYRNASTTRAAAAIEAGADELVLLHRDDPHAVIGGLKMVVARRAAQSRAAGAHATDPVTGLLNRASFEDFLRVAMRDSEDPEEELALLYMDLDRFKQINDSLGHSAGDRVLGLVARQLESAAAACGGEVALARFGGDEFVVLVKGHEAVWAARSLAQQVRSRLQSPLRLQGHTPSVTPSIGIAMAAAGDDTASWIERADMALYRAKSNGRNRIEEFDRSLRLWAQRSSERFDGLRQSIREDGLKVHLSAVESCTDNRLVGLWALPKWDADREYVGHNVQYVADQCGIGPTLAHWSLATAIRLAAARDVPVVTPFASCLFALSESVPFIEATMEECRVRPSLLRLLIDERTLANEDIVGATIESLRNLGVGMIVDQFGSHSGSLTALSRWRLDAVVFDSTWIVGVRNSPERQAVLDGILRSVHGLGYRSICPRAVSEADQSIVRELGCNFEIVPVVDLPDIRDDGASRRNTPISAR